MTNKASAAPTASAVFSMMIQRRAREKLDWGGSAALMSFPTAASHHPAGQEQEEDG